MTLSKLAHGLVALMAVECGVTAIAFACAGQWKFAAYWFGATIINTAAYYF